MQKEEFSIIAKNISKSYKMYSSPKEKFLDLISPKGAGKDFYALRDLSFTVKKGDIVGLVGLNGSGKSTLSNILGGVSMPTSGKIEIKGEAAIIAIGLGLNNFLTGIENIEIKALMMGYKKSEIEAIKKEIIEFADIGDFINQPIRTYSSGMRSRLGFAISVHTNPDILVIDEALSVGDPTFTQKCLDKMHEFKEKGKTVFFVSHSTSQIKQFCNKVIWLEYGRLREYGDVNDILPKYEKYIKYINSMNKEERKEYRNKVLIEQEHSLLKEFKIIDPKFKQVYPKGKLFKFVTLINKKLDINVVPYNFDYYTLLFGFIPSILRKRFDVALGIFIAQVLIFFVISFPFAMVVNFIFTALCSLFTGRQYIMYLIENKENIDFNVWKKYKKYTLEKEINERHLKEDIRSKILFEKVAIIISIICLLGLLSATMIYKYYREEYSLVSSSSEVIISDNTAMILAKENKILAINILNQNKGQKNIRVTSIPGKIQVNNNGVYDELANVVNANDVDLIKKLLNDSLNIKLGNYVLIDMSDIEESHIKVGTIDEINSNKNSELLDSIQSYTKLILSRFAELEDSQVKNFEKFLATNSSISIEKLEEFHSWIKKDETVINEIEYISLDIKEISITEIIPIEDLELIGKSDLKDLKFLCIEKEDLKNNKIIKELEDYIKNEKEEIEENIEELEEELDVMQTEDEEIYTETQSSEDLSDESIWGEDTWQDNTWEDNTWQDNTSEGDTSEGDVSEGDISTGDTSGGDNSAGDTSGGDISVENSSAENDSSENQNNIVDNS